MDLNRSIPPLPPPINAAPQQTQPNLSQTTSYQQTQQQTHNAADIRLIKALLTRITEKLPFASGMPISLVAADSVFVQNVSWIVEQAPWHAQDIASDILASLDIVGRTHDIALSTNSEQLAVSIAQSQLVLARMLLYVLARFWSFHREIALRTPGKATSVPQSASAANASATVCAAANDKLRATAASFDADALEARHHFASSSRPRGLRIASARSADSSAPSPLSAVSSPTSAMASSVPPPDPLLVPPPLDETLAQDILNHSIRFFFTPANNINLELYSHATSSPNGSSPPTDPTTQDWLQSATTASAGSMNGSIPSFFRHSKHCSLSATISSILTIKNSRSDEIERELEHTAALIIYFVSASNWPLVLSRIRGRITTLHAASGSSNALRNIQASADVGQDGYDVNLAEIRMLECCHLDARRLSILLAEIGLNLKIFNKKAITVLAVALRRAVWNWIDANPTEFSSIYHHRRNLDGHPETIFEYLQSNADSPRKKSIFWPTQTMLLLLMAEDLVRYTSSGASDSSFSKKIQFLESLKKTLRTKGYDLTTTLCYADICRAATCANRSDISSLRILIGSFETELKEKLFDPTKPVLAVVDEGAGTDDRVIPELLASLFKLNPVNVLRNLYPGLVDMGNGTMYRVVFMKSCSVLVNDVTPVPWNPPIDPSLCDMIRQLFIEYVGREVAMDVKTKRPLLKIQRDRRARKILAEETERTEIVIHALSCWASSPFLLVARDNFVIPCDELQVMFQLIVACLLDTSDTIRYLASRVLLRIMDPDFIPYWDGTRPDWRLDRDTIAPSESTMRTFWRLTSILFISISRHILETYSNPDFDTDIVHDLGTLLSDLLYHRNIFLRYRSRQIPVVMGSMVSERVAASVSMEIMLLFLLTSVDMGVSRSAVVSLMRLVEEADITGESMDGGAGGVGGSDFVEEASSGWNAASGISNSRTASLMGLDTISNASGSNTNTPASDTTSIASTPQHRLATQSANAPVTNIPSLPLIQNITAYRELGVMFESAAAGTGGTVILSNKIQQKVIRKSLLMMERASPGNLGAWEEVYRRWRIMSNVLVRSGGSGASGNPGGSGGSNLAGSTSTPDLVGTSGSAGISSVGNVMSNTATKLDGDEDMDMMGGGGRGAKQFKYRHGGRTPSSSLPKTSGETFTGYGEDQVEWNNYTGFLCSLGNVCLLASQAATSGSGAVNVASGAVHGAINSSPLTREQTVSSTHSSHSVGGDKGGKLQRTSTIHTQDKLRSAVDDTSMGGSSSATSSNENVFDAPTGTSPSAQGAATGSTGPLAWANWNAAITPQIVSSFGRARGAVDRFIRDLVDMLTNDNPAIREVVRDFLINELSGGLYGILFTHFEKQVTMIFSLGTDYMCNDRNTMMVEVMMSIMRSVLDRAEELYENDHTNELRGDAGDVAGATGRGVSAVGASGVVASGSSGAPSVASTSRPASATMLSLYAIDFAWMMIHLTRYINRLAIFPHLAPTVFRNKVRVCQLVELLVQKRDIVGIRQDVFFRNHMVEVLLEWNSEFGARVNDQVFSSAEAASKAIIELDQTTMRVMVTLLEGLPLVPVTESGGNLSELRDDDDDGIKSRLFSTYLTFFLKVLQTCKVVEGGLDTSRVQSNTAEMRTLIAKTKESMHHLAVVKDNTIAALSNLIAANIKAGLKYSLSIAYHEDPRTQSAFMHVLTNILQGGSVSGLLKDDWQESKYQKLLDLVTDDNLAIVLTLCEVMSTNDTDEIAVILFGIFERCGKFSHLITSVIDDEIEHTEAAASIFRRNSIATRLLSIYANNEGQDFLMTTLNRTLQGLATMSTPMSFEIDPARVNPGDNIAANMANLKQLTQQFLTNILGSVNRFPSKLRRICSIVFEAVERKFPSSGLLGVGAFVFLRFICPAIVAPDRHGLLKHPLPAGETRRATILVTKIIQNLANCVLFGNKEAYMIGMNDLLEKNSDAFRSFLVDISGSSFSRSTSSLGLNERSAADDAVMGVHFDDLRGYLTQLHRHLETNFSKMERTVSAAFSEKQIVPNVSKFGTLRGDKEHKMETPNSNLMQMSSPSQYPITPLSASLGGVGVSATEIMRRKTAIDQLSVLLVQLGPAPPLTEKNGNRNRYAAGQNRNAIGAGGSGSTAANASGAGAISGASAQASGSSGSSSGLGFATRDAFGRAASNRAYVEFMRRQNGMPAKNVTSDYVRERRLFYDGGMSVEGRPTFVYVARNFIAESVDMDALIYVILDLGQAHMTKPFDIVVDLTFSGPDNEWSTEGLHTIERVMPPEARQNLHTIIFLHPNSYFRVMAKRAPRLLHSRMAKRVLFASNLSEFASFATREKLQLPKSTINIYDQQMTTFSNVNVHPSKSTSTPVKLVLTTDTFHVVMSKKQDIMGLQVPTIDIFRIADIRDIGASDMDPRNADIEFFVKLNEPQAAAAGGSSGSGASIIYFSSPRRDEILQAIRAAIARFQLSRPPVTTDQRDVSPRDLPGTLLNIALLNLGSDEPALRVASYDLLCAIISSFGFNPGTRLQTTRGIAIPANSHKYVIDISSKLAASEHALTFEFLSEALLGYPKLPSRSLKHYMLQYISPWLPNLSQYIKPADSISNALKAEAARQKLVHIITSLIQLTLKEQESFFILQTEVWSVLGNEASLLPTVIDLFVETATQLPVGAPETEVLANTLISVVIPNPKVSSGLIIKAIHDTLAATSRTPKASTVDHPVWRQIQTLLRFVLMLSFDDKLCVETHLPDIFHMVSLLAGMGTPIVRRTIHGIVLNTLQVLARTPGLSETGLAGLQIALDRLQSPKFGKIFGLATTNADGKQTQTSSNALTVASGSRDRFIDYSTPAFVFSTDTIQGESVKEVGLIEMGALISILVDMTTYGAVNFETSAGWKTRWISLAARTAFEKNLTAQARSFLVVGSLAKDGFDSELLIQTLVALRSALTAFDETRPQLAQSVVMCLCDALHSAPAQENIISSLFWIGIELVQIGYIPLAQSGLTLLQVVIRLMEDNPSYRGVHLRHTLLAGRNCLGDGAKRLENDTLVVFDDYFSFAIASVLFRGLRINSLKAATETLLTSLIEFSCIQSSTTAGKSAAERAESSANGLASPAETETGSRSSSITMPEKPTITMPEKPTITIRITTSDGQNGKKAVSVPDLDIYDFVRDTLGYLIPLLMFSDRPQSLLALAGLTRRVHQSALNGDRASGHGNFVPSSGASVTSSGNIAQHGSSMRDLNASSHRWIQRLISSIPLHDNATAAVVSAFLQVLLEQSEVESEILLVHRVIGAVADQAPQAFLPFYIALYSQLSNTLLSTKSPKLSEAVYAIFQSMSIIPPHEVKASESLFEDPRALALQYGLAGLYVHPVSDPKEAKDRRLAVVAQTIESVYSSGSF